MSHASCRCSIPLSDNRPREPKRKGLVKSWLHEALVSFRQRPGDQPARRASWLSGVIVSRRRAPTKHYMMSVGGFSEGVFHIWKQSFFAGQVEVFCLSKDRHMAFRDTASCAFRGQRTRMSVWFRGFRRNWERCESACRNASARQNDRNCWRRSSYGRCRIESAGARCGGTAFPGCACPG